MENGKQELTRKYPRELLLGDRSLTLRLMKPTDRATLFEFVRGLPPDDLLFLRLNVATEEGMDEWVRNLEAGRTTTVMAVQEDGSVAGYASVHHNEVLWSRHVGELRVIVGSDFRRIGLGRRLTDEVFAIARGLGLRKVTAQMTPDQKGARATFERLGFRPEALLADFVVDGSGKARDLLIMAHDVDGFSDVQYRTATASS